MSIDRHLVCKTCKEAIWIGQSDIIYTGMPDVMKMLQDFLYKHETWHDHENKDYHELLFVPEPYNGAFENYSWKYWEVEDWKKDPENYKPEDRNLK
jgi:hypothetical protein